MNSIILYQIVNSLDMSINDNEGTNSYKGTRTGGRKRYTRQTNSPATLRVPADYDSDTDNGPGLTHMSKTPKAGEKLVLLA